MAKEADFCTQKAWIVILLTANMPVLLLPSGPYEPCCSYRPLFSMFPFTWIRVGLSLLQNLLRRKPAPAAMAFCLFQADGTLQRNPEYPVGRDEVNSKTQSAGDDPGHQL